MSVKSTQCIETQFEFRLPGLLSANFLIVTALFSHFYVLTLLTFVFREWGKAPFWLHILYIGGIAAAFYLNFRRPKYRWILISNEWISYPQPQVFGYAKREMPLTALMSLERDIQRGKRVLILNFKGEAPVIIKQSSIVFHDIESIYDAIISVVRKSPYAAEILRRFDHADRLKAQQKKVPVASLTVIGVIGLWSYLKAVVATDSDPVLRAVEIGGLVPTLALHGQVYRFFTATIVHASLIHALSNAAFVALLGYRIEKLIGSSRYLLVFLSGSVCANLISSFTGDFFAICGASGGVFALISVYCAILFRYQDSLPSTIKPTSNRMLLLGLVLVLVPESNRNNLTAHLSGLVIGAIFGWWFTTNFVSSRVVSRWLAVGTCMAYGIALTVGVLRISLWRQDKENLPEILITNPQSNKSETVRAASMLLATQRTSDPLYALADAKLASFTGKTADIFDVLGRLAIRRLDYGRAIEMFRLEILNRNKADPFSLKGLLRKIEKIPAYDIRTAAESLVDAEYGYVKNSKECRTYTNVKNETVDAISIRENGLLYSSTPLNDELLELHAVYLGNGRVQRILFFSIESRKFFTTLKSFSQNGWVITSVLSAASNSELLQTQIDGLDMEFTVPNKSKCRVAAE